MTFVNAIQKAFFGEDIQTQYPVDIYKIDIYFPKYKLAVEFDENEHRYKQAEDLKRQRYIEDAIKCKFIRVNETCCIYEAINKIIQIIYRQT